MFQNHLLICVISTLRLQIPQNHRIPFHFRGLKIFCVNFSIWIWLTKIGFVILIGLFIVNCITNSNDVCTRKKWNVGCVTVPKQCALQCTVTIEYTFSDEDRLFSSMKMLVLAVQRGLFCISHLSVWVWKSHS